MSKSLFDADDRYTPDATELCRLMVDVLEPLFEEFVNQRGYSMRGVSCIGYGVVAELECKFALSVREPLKKEPT